MPSLFAGRVLMLILLCLLPGLFSGCKKEDKSWHLAQKQESHTTDRLNQIFFLNDSIGFVVGGQRFLSATLLTTRDGGSTWAHSSFPEAGKGLYGITATENGALYIVGFDGKLLYSFDQGNTWGFSQLTKWNSFKKLAEIDNQLITVGGISFEWGFSAYIDAGAGASMNVVRWDTVAYELNDIEIANDKVGYIAGFGVVLKTTDGGNTWKLLDVKNDNFQAVTVLDENTAWICGYNGSIRYTANGGTDWETLRKGNNALGRKYRLLDLCFLNSMDGWAVGEDGLVIYSKDGGRNWTEYERFTSHALRSIVQTPDGHMLVAGDNGSLYKLMAQ